MEAIGIFYGSTYGMTEKSAKEIKKAFGRAKVDVYNLADAGIEDMKKYRNLIFGTSAWGIGEMQDDWERFIDRLPEMDFSERKLALFGLGDQKEYPESFVDGLGTLYCRLPDKSCVVGQTSTESYDFYFSLANKDGEFVGLVLDEHHQKDLTAQRIKKWVAQLKKEFI
ncbi:MAG: flavodoxin [Bacteroidales bacterium]|nr:flavodoxin [Bacteroidales bacterium]